MPAPKKQGTFDVIDLIIFEGIAALFELGSVIPGVGDLGIMVFRVIFWFKNIETKLMNTMMVGSGLVEIMPAISVFPGVMTFVAVTFIEVQLQKRLAKKLAKAAPAARQLDKVSLALGPEDKAVTS